MFANKMSLNYQYDKCREEHEKTKKKGENRSMMAELNKYARRRK